MCLYCEHHVCIFWSWCAPLQWDNVIQRGQPGAPPAQDFGAMPKVPLPLDGKVALRQLIATGLDQARGCSWKCWSFYSHYSDYSHYMSL